VSSAGLEALPQRELVVHAREASWRLDLFLARRLGLTRAEARRLLEQGAVVLGGRRLGLHDKGSRLVAGTRIEVAGRVSRRELAPLAEPQLPLRVLSQGPGWLAVDKPAGSPVHPLRSGEQGTLLNALAARHPAVVGVGEAGLRSGVVHRLDVDTSGVLLFALEDAAWTRLREAFRAQRVEKVYRALVRGRLCGEGHERLVLHVARHRPARVRVLRPGGAGGVQERAAELRWRVLEALPGATLVEVRPRTGFLHQIRVTFAHLGHPVVGDRTYGAAADDPFRAPRQLLHATRLRFEEVAAESPDPPDLTAALQALRGV
jgi:23S rRNA pseudouridine1911/1915/1917 synthase